MGKKSISVLLIEDDPVAAGLFHAQLASDFTSRFVAEVVDTLERAQELLERRHFDVAVLDLILPDTRGLASLDRLRAGARELPVVVLTGLDDEELAVRALQHGAQDYLVKGDLTGRLISRSLRYAIERQRLTEALRSLSLLDDLTGLFNRRGFLTLADQQVKVARRLKRGVALISVDQNGSDGENEAGAQSLAQLLRDVFRGSDLVARVSESTFVVLAIEADRDGADRAVERLRSALAAEAPPRPRVGLEWTASDALTNAAHLVSRLGDSPAAAGLSRDGGGSRP